MDPPPDPGSSSLGLDIDPADLREARIPYTPTPADIEAACRSIREAHLRAKAGARSPDRSGEAWGGRSCRAACGPRYPSGQVIRKFVRHDHYPWGI